MRSGRTFRGHDGYACNRRRGAGFICRFLRYFERLGRGPSARHRSSGVLQYGSLLCRKVFRFGRRDVGAQPWRQRSGDRGGTAMLGRGERTDGPGRAFLRAIAGIGRTRGGRRDRSRARSVSIRLYCVRGRVDIGSEIRRPPIANDLDGKQAVNSRQAREVAQNVAPFPGSFVTSAHTSPTEDHAPASRRFYFKLQIMTRLLQTPRSDAQLRGTRLESLVSRITSGVSAAAVRRAKRDCCRQPDTRWP